MPRRFVAGGIGAVMALGFYIVLGALAPTPPRLIEASPMESPGEPGNAVINGHVNWWTGDAVFTHLSRLRIGDEVRVVRADGRTVVFKVSSKRTVDANARIPSLFAPSTDTTLTLITCSGTWNPMTQSDTQRLLVSATVA
ncbi:MAG: class F sortase [Chloroflexi bacterium]|nr:MAG: class F sortase [Chloroflexota bacterium]